MAENNEKVFSNTVINCLTTVFPIPHKNPVKQVKTKDLILHVFCKKSVFYAFSKFLGFLPKKCRRNY